MALTNESALYAGVPTDNPMLARQLGLDTSLDSNLYGFNPNPYSAIPIQYQPLLAALNKEPATGRPGVFPSFSYGASPYAALVQALINAAPNLPRPGTAPTQRLPLLGQNFTSGPPYSPERPFFRTQPPLFSSRFGGIGGYQSLSGRGYSAPFPARTPDKFGDLFLSGRRKEYNFQGGSNVSDLVGKFGPVTSGEPDQFTRFLAGDFSGQTGAFRNFLDAVGTKGAPTIEHGYPAIRFGARPGEFISASMFAPAGTNSSTRDTHPISATDYSSQNFPQLYR